MTGDSCRSATASVKELRATVRYSLCARVVFRWRDESGQPREGRGCTRDISPRGAYVLASAGPPRGASVAMNIYLPTVATGARNVCVETTGQVLRTDPSGAGSCVGFSIRNERMVLCTI
jgi:hypothetical protein